MKTKQVINSWKKIRHQFIPNVGTVVFVALMLFTFNAWAAPAAQEIGAVIPYQGTLTDSSGNPINSNIDMTFRLYNVSSGGTALWEEAYTGSNAVPVVDGLFQVMLGSLTPVPSSIWEISNIYLGIQIGSDPEMAPRELMGNNPRSNMAFTVPDASITNSNLNLNGPLNMGTKPYSVAWTANYPEFYFRNDGGAMRFISAGDIRFFLDSDNNSSDDQIRVLKNSASFSSPAVSLLTLSDDGSLWIRGSLQSGAYVENNLQTLEERDRTKINRFTKGDVLCWDSSEQILYKCSDVASPLIIAVADENGKPIVLGAEPIKVLGPVQPGDLLVASDTPGYAVAWSQTGTGNPPAGVVIAKALESFDDEAGLVKAMIMGY